MKVTLKIELEFESWFEEEREPKSKEEWAEFFNEYLMPEGFILGVDDGEFQDMVAMSSYIIECTDVV
jgi:hypothetical protein